MKIKIPFKKKFRKKILDGTKTVTRRYKKYGNTGDVFVVELCSGHLERMSRYKKIKLTNVYSERLGAMTEEEALKEGCDSLEDFKKVWVEIHPRRGWKPNNLVTVHRWD